MKEIHILVPAIIESPRYAHLAERRRRAAENQDHLNAVLTILERGTVMRQKHEFPLTDKEIKDRQKEAVRLREKLVSAVGGINKELPRAKRRNGLTYSK